MFWLLLLYDIQFEGFARLQVETMWGLQVIECRTSLGR